MTPRRLLAAVAFTVGGWAAAIALTLRWLWRHDLGIGS